MVGGDIGGHFAELGSMRWVVVHGGLVELDLLLFDGYVVGR